MTEKKRDWSKRTRQRPDSLMQMVDLCIHDARDDKFARMNCFFWEMDQEIKELEATLAAKEVHALEERNAKLEEQNKVLRKNAEEHDHEMKEIRILLGQADGVMRNHRLWIDSLGIYEDKAEKLKTKKSKRDE